MCSALFIFQHGFSARLHQLEDGVESASCNLSKLRLSHVMLNSFKFTFWLRHSHDLPGLCHSSTASQEKESEVGSLTQKALHAFQFSKKRSCELGSLQINLYSLWILWSLVSAKDISGNMFF